MSRPFRFCAATGLAAFGIFSIVRADGPDPTLIRKIFSDQSLWGKNIPSVYVHLPSWNKISEKTVSIYSDRVMGGKQYADAPSATESAKVLSVWTRTTRSRVNSGVSAAWKSNFLPWNANLTAEVIPYFLEEEASKVVWTAPAGNLLPAGLTAETVHKRLGTPDQIVRQAIQNTTEHKPTSLIMHYYANGAVIFAESEQPDKAGQIDRVIVDLGLIQKALFQEGN